jgi:hypothetical protein
MNQCATFSPTWGDTKVSAANPCASITSKTPSIVAAAASHVRSSDKPMPKTKPVKTNSVTSTLGCVHQTDGTVIKLIGDAIFAVWNAPEPQAGHQELACRAALLLRDQLVPFEAENESFLFHTRVGLHFGVACVGNCGSAERFDYTAIGSDINLASDHLMGAVEGKFICRSVGHFRLKGVDRVLEVFELVATPECAQPTRVWREAFKEALRRFRQPESSKTCGRCLDTTKRG